MTPPTAGAEDATDATDATTEPTPVSSAWATELDFIVETATAAGNVLMDLYERLETVRYKSPKDVVTEADHRAEDLIISAIRERFPADAILSEEAGSLGAARVIAPRGPTPNGRVWVIDPLDGTVNYANGLPVFCTSIGLVAEGRPVAGGVLDPTRAELYAATADGPATLNGRPVQVSAKEQLSDYVVSLALTGRAVVTRARAVRKAVRVSRNMGSAALALAWTANGRFDAFLQEDGLSAWDIAAAGLVAERAGALVTTFSGSTWYDPSRRTRTMNLVAAPAVHHERLRQLVAGEAS